MSQKQSILGRISMLAKANINSLLDRAEDPEKMLDQMVRDYTNSIAEAEEAVAQTIASLRMAEQDYTNDVATAEDWGRKARSASERGEQLRQQGNTSEAERFDGLARLALGKQISFEKEARDAEPMIAQQREVVAKLKDGLVAMKSKLDELKSRRSSLVARARTAEAQTKVQEAIGSINVLDPTSELSRWEDKVRQQEALAQGRAEAASSSLEDQFAELESSNMDTIEIESRLAALKGGGTQALTSGGSPALQAQSQTRPEQQEDVWDAQVEEERRS